MILYGASQWLNYDLFGLFVTWARTKIVVTGCEGNGFVKFMLMLSKMFDFYYGDS